MRKKAALLLLFLFLFPAATGCYDRREPDEVAYVAAIGLDKGGTDRLRLSLQIVRLAEGGRGIGMGGGGGQEAGPGDETVIITVDCPSPFTGMNMASTSVTRQLNLMHAKVLIFSDELAGSQDFEKYISGLVRYREIRKIMHIMVTRGKAEDFMKENKTVIGENPPKTLQMLADSSAFTGFIPDTNLFKFYNNFKSTFQRPVTILAGVNSLKNLKKPGEGEMQESTSGGNYLAGELPREGYLKRELFGTAVFDGAKMTGELNGTETRALLMIKGEFKRGFFTIKDPIKPGYVVPLDVFPSRKPEIKVNVQGQTPEINVKIRLEGDILAVQSRENYEKPELKPVLEQAFENEIKSQVDSVIAKCQREFGTDIFGFGRTAASKFLTIEDWENYRWHEQFPNATVNTEVDFTIRRTGLMLKSSPIVSVEESIK